MTGAASIIRFDVHTTVLIVCVAILLAAFGAMFYSVFAHRRARSAAVAAQWHEHAMVELLWTIVPVFILFGSAWPAMRSVLEAKQNEKAYPAVAGPARETVLPVGLQFATALSDARWTDAATGPGASRSRLLAESRFAAR